MSWLVLGFKGAPPKRDFGELSLGQTRLIRVDRSDPSISAHVDPAWAVTELLVVAPGDESPAWERRLAKELALALAESVSGQAREVELAASPTCLEADRPSRRRAAPTLDAAGFAAWLGTVCEDRRVIDQGLVDAIRRHCGLLPAASLVVATARTKPHDLQALEETVRERFGRDLPADYLTFLREVGALRIEVVEDGDRSPLGPVLLPAKAVTNHLCRGSWLTDRTDGDFMPFFRFGDDEYFAFDFADAEPNIVVALCDGEIEHRAASFSEWLAAWREASLIPELAAKRSARSSLTSAAGLERWWTRNRGWVRQMYDGHDPG